MDASKMIIEQLSSPPSQQANELPVITSNKVLPFNRLTWEDFERFCFQLGSKSMKCLDTSYVYGRQGQKQDGIDLYFHTGAQNIVWQVKRYSKFQQTDVSNAVDVFLKGKWFGKVSEFTLCVSDYINDTGIVDEINKQTSALERNGVIFSVLNSEKLTIKAKEFPDLIEAFFGKHWVDAIGISKSNDGIFYIKLQQIFQKCKFDMIFLDQSFDAPFNDCFFDCVDEGCFCIRDLLNHECSLEIPAKTRQELYYFTQLAHYTLTGVAMCCHPNGTGFAIPRYDPENSIAISENVKALQNLYVGYRFR